MADSKRAWDDVSERFAALGRRFDQHRSDAVPAPDGETTTDDGAAERDRQTLQAAVDDLGRALDRVTNAIGPTVRDPAFRDDAKAAVRSLGEALSATLTEVGGSVRDALRRDSSKADVPSPADAASSAETPEGASAAESDSDPSPSS